MKTIINVIIFVLFFNNFPVIAQFNAVEFIEKVQTFQDSIKVEYNKDTKRNQLVCFDFNKYMQMFNALKIKDSHYIFDYFYFSEGLSGIPFIYVRKPTFDLLSHFKATMKNPEDDSEGMSLVQMLNCILIDSIIPKNTERMSPFDRILYFLNDSILWTDTEWMSLDQKVFNFLTDSVNKACNSIIPEDTEEGYMQYLFFHEFGEQFALSGRVNYKKRAIVCSEIEMKEIVKQCTEMNCDKGAPNDAERPVEECFECNSIALAEMLKTGVSPIIEMQENCCFIILYEKNMSGVFKETFQVMRSEPYEVILRDKKEIVSIIGGYIF